MILFVVDDEQDMQALFQQRYRKQIRSGNISLIFKESGHEALQALPNIENGRVIMFIDLQLNDMSGIKLMNQIQEKYNIDEFYVVSGMADEETKKQCVNKGADGFIVKPIDFKLVDEILDL